MHKKKAKFDFFENFRFVISTVFSAGRNILLSYFLLVPLGVIIPTVSSYIPKILLDLVEKNVFPQKMIFVVACLTFGMISLNFLHSRLSCFSDLNTKKISRKLDLLFAKKVMTMPYENMEGPTGRNAYQKAKNSLGHYGSYSYVNYMFELIKNILGIVVYSIIISQINIWFVPIIIGVEILGGIVAAIIRKYENKLKNRRALIDREINYISNAAKSFSAAKDIRLYSMQNFFMEKTKNLLLKKKELVAKGQKYYAQNDVFASLLIALITGGTYIYLVYNLLKNDLTTGDIVLYVGVITGFASWLEGAADSFDSLMRANHAISDVRSFLCIAEDECMRTGIRITGKDFEKWEIEFENVSYQYTGSQSYALKNVSFKISNGERLAIVGYNGAGKTTIIKLMCGLYNATEGNIKLNGVNINQYNKADYFKLFSLVFQDIRVLPESIKANITSTKNRNIELEKIYKNLQDVGLYERISVLEQGIETKLMKNINFEAAEFSGGENQKLVMARALYKDSPFVILDEPTAALDPVAENELYIKYNDLVKEKTSVFISHRLSSTRFCDKIIFIDKGEIIECGTHSELMNNNGHYAELYNIQSHYYKEKCTQETI